MTPFFSALRLVVRPVSENTRKPLSILAVAALAVFTLSACSSMPLREGERARLMSGINEPRARADIDITVYKVPVTAWGKCLEILAETRPLMALASAVTLNIYHACARVPKDKSLKHGQRAWCIVAVPEGDEDALEHELRHCEGWDHPHPGRLETAQEDEGDWKPPIKVSARRSERVSTY